VKKKTRIAIFLGFTEVVLNSMVEFILSFSWVFAILLQHNFLSPLLCFRNLFLNLYKIIISGVYDVWACIGSFSSLPICLCTCGRYFQRIGDSNTGSHGGGKESPMFHSFKKKSIECAE